MAGRKRHSAQVVFLVYGKYYTLVGDGPGFIQIGKAYRYACELWGHYKGNSGRGVFLEDMFEVVEDRLATASELNKLKSSWATDNTLLGFGQFRIIELKKIKRPRVFECMPKYQLHYLWWAA